MAAAVCVGVAVLWGGVLFLDVGLVVTESTAASGVLLLLSIFLLSYGFHLYCRAFERRAADSPIKFNSEPTGRARYIEAMFRGASDSVVVLADHLWPGVYADGCVIRTIKEKQVEGDEDDHETHGINGEGLSQYRRIPVWVLVRCNDGETYGGDPDRAGVRELKKVSYEEHAFLDAIRESKTFELAGVWYVGDIRCHNLILVDGNDSRVEYYSPALHERLHGPEKGRFGIIRRNNPRAYKRGARLMRDALSTSKTPVAPICVGTPKYEVRVSGEVKPFVDDLDSLLTSAPKEQAAA